MYQRNSNEQGPAQRQRPGNPGNGDDDKGNNPRSKGISLLRVFLLTIALVAVFAAGSLFLLATGSREYSEQTAIIIDEEVNRIVKWAYDRAVSLLTTHRETLDGIAHSLLLHETLDARQLRAILEDTSAAHTGPL